MFLEKTKFQKEYKHNVGGTDYVPPTLCPRAANVTANAAANVERTGRRRNALPAQKRTAGRTRQKASFLAQERSPA